MKSCFKFLKTSLQKSNIFKSTSAFFVENKQIYIYIYNMYGQSALHRCRLRLSRQGNAEFTPSTITIVCASKSRTGVQVSFMYGTKNAMRTSQ